MISAAGILFKAGDRILLVKRGDGGDHAGEWSIPAGHIEEGESAEEAAVRECEEELGVDAHSLGAVVPWTRSQNDGVDFTSFIVRTGRKFKVKINDESEDYDWAKIGALPQPLHPGVQLLIDRLTMNELDIARVMSEGKLVSPQRYENILLVAMRITGTGVAFRKQLGEYVYRDPKITLTDEFLARCNGLPVIVEHPEKNSLDSKEFQDRIVGTTFLPYINADDVWGIVKIYDDATAKMIEDHVLSTSPAVVFRDQSVNETQKLENGATLLIEGKPSLLDHLAIVPLGVWDKGGEPSGVDSLTATTGGSTVNEEELAKKMAEEEKGKADKARMDADAGATLDKILKCVDSMSSRLDALESGKRKDAEGEEEDLENGEPVPAAADKAKKDAELEAEKEMREDKARKDAEEKVRKRVADLEEKMPKQMSDSDYKEMAEAQEKADKVHSAFGDSAPRPLNGESLVAYRKRLANGLRKHSAAWKDIDLYKLDSSVLAVAEPQIYADAMNAARNPVDLPDGELRPIVTQDATGRRITSFAGQPRSWMQAFGANRRRVAGIRNATR